MNIDRINPVLAAPAKPEWGQVLARDPRCARGVGSRGMGFADSLAGDGAN